MPSDHTWNLDHLLYGILMPVMGNADADGRVGYYTSGFPYIDARVVEGAQEEFQSLLLRLETTEEPQATETLPVITPEIVQRVADVDEMFRVFKQYHFLHLGPGAVRDLDEIGAAIGRLTDAVQRELTNQSEGDG